MRLFISMICALYLTAAVGPGVAQESQKVGTIRVKMAVIDMNEIRRNAAAVKDIRAQVENLRAAFQTEIKNEEEELRAANQELGRQRAILSSEAFTEERRKFEQRLAGVQRKVQQRKQNLDKALNDAMFEVQKSLNKDRRRSRQGAQPDAGFAQGADGPRGAATQHDGRRAPTVGSGPAYGQGFRIRKLGHGRPAILLGGRTIHP